MDTTLDPTLQRIKDGISPEAWQRRVREARRRAEELDQVEALLLSGMSKAGAIQKVAAGDPLTTWKERLSRYRSGGWQALINRCPVGGRRKITPEVIAVVRGLLEGDPELRSEALCAKVDKLLGVHIAGTTMRKLLRGEGLAHRVGPAGGKTKAEALPLAGAELLKGVEAELGAVRRLTGDLKEAIDALPVPEGPVLDDRANRDERGRFLPSYNEGQSKGEADLGPKFETVDIRRQGRDLRATRTANSSFQSLYRKVLSLVLLPSVIDTPRPDGLRHWQGQHLEGLVGVAYMPETVNKFMRDLKLAGMADTARESVARFWMSQEGPVVDPVTGAVVLYADTTTKPIWTHHFTKSTPVGKLGGRVMPAMSTVMLHTGTGTPLLYRSFSGTVSLPNKVLELLREYEAAAGEGTARRLLVMDREGHAIEYMKKLSKNWLYIVPLRSNVLGPNAQFKDLSEWIAYGEAGDKVREGRLLLRDRRKGEEDLWVRVVARQRHRTGKVAWYATNAPQDAFEPPVILDRYFDRWPLQEHRFRDAYGRVGLHVHHGFGKRLVDNIAVLDKLEKLEGRIRKLERARNEAAGTAEELAHEAALLQEAIDKVAARIAELRVLEDKDVADGASGSARFAERHQILRQWDGWYESTRTRLDKVAQSRDDQAGKVEAAKASLDKAHTDVDKLSRRTKIYTVDTELDEIMTAFKLTFINLCVHLMKHYLGDTRMELDTLIQAVLTLPGERLVTARTETIRIFRYDRDRQVMPLVENACRLLTEKRLVRNKRRLIYEIVDRPSP